VHVVGRNGEVLVALRGDDASPHTMENSMRKAYTSRTFRIASGEFATRVKAEPTLGQVHLANIVASQGALPIKAGEDIIGAVGVSGAPGGDKDEVCAKSGIGQGRRSAEIGTQRLASPCSGPPEHGEARP